MEALRLVAKELLESKKVDVVIGYEVGTGAVRPAFIDSPADVGKLIFDTRCVQNLATYLNPRRKHLARYKRKAVVAKSCDAKAVAALIREHQVKREDIVVIGVRCGGVGKNPLHAGPLTEETVADRCGDCESREPKLADHLVGEMPPAPPVSKVRKELLAKLDAMVPEERMAWWMERINDCIRCHACREVCPLCYCARCVADKSQPQWIDSSAHPQANFSWQFTRAMHQAGRCVDCGECERVCPSGIPLALMNKKIAEVVKQRFNHTPSDDPSVPAPIGQFRTDDGQEFIR